MLEIKGALSDAERLDQMQQAIVRFPFLKRQPPNENKISIVGYGPSLRTTWHQIPHPIMTVSGAHDFLLGKGIVPRWHVELDPRQHKPEMLRRPQVETDYLMASCCHPDFWDILESYNVQLWHLINGNDPSTMDWVRQHHPAGIDCMIGGGSTVGQRAMNVAAFMGYRRFNVFGMDMSYKETTHAGKHTGDAQPRIRIACGDRVFETSPQLLQSAKEFEQFLGATTDVEVTFHGDGLLQEMDSMIQRRKRGI